MDARPKTAPKTAPTIVTARLTLSMPAPGDLDDMAAMWADPAVYAMIGGRAFTREETWARLLRYIGHWHTLGYGGWTVRETASGRHVGDVTLMDSRRATVPSFEGTPEAGWVLAPWAHGRGFAREALAAMFAFADPRIARTLCIVDHANLRSIALAQAFGYASLGDVVYRDGTVALFERIAKAR